MNEKTTLLEKYSIPVEHLDFNYIKTCKNVGKLEKMVEILRSGEEGHYPDLTKFAECKLHELDPDNRMLRHEVKCFNTGTTERQAINDFVRVVKDKDRKIRVEMDIDDNFDDTLPPVRSTKDAVNAIDALKSIKSKPQKITSFDYQQWDKYDADTECLKIDLNEERIREHSIAEEKRREQQKQPKLIEVLSEETTHDDISDVERFEFADRHRIKGNEFFKCCEYSDAILEYSKSLSYAPTAAVHNNRAVAYLKQKLYTEAIRDCDKCLKIEATNVKAMLRKCDALIALNRNNDAYKLYVAISKIDPENTVAKQALKNISIRLEIQDINVQLPHETILLR